jgi:hypothetical protein
VISQSAYVLRGTAPSPRNNRGLQRKNSVGHKASTPIRPKPRSMDKKPIIMLRKGKGCRFVGEPLPSPSQAGIAKLNPTTSVISPGFISGYPRRLHCHLLHTGVNPRALRDLPLAAAFKRLLRVGLSEPMSRKGSCREVRRYYNSRCHGRPGIDHHFSEGGVELRRAPSTRKRVRARHGV